MSDPKKKSIKMGFPILLKKKNDKDNIMKILNKIQHCVDLVL